MNLTPIPVGAADKMLDTLVADADQLEDATNRGNTFTLDGGGLPRTLKAQFRGLAQKRVNTLRRPFWNAEQIAAGQSPENLTLRLMLNSWRPGLRWGAYGPSDGCAGPLTPHGSNDSIRRPQSTTLRPVHSIRRWTQRSLRARSGPTSALQSSCLAPDASSPSASGAACTEGASVREERVGLAHSQDHYRSGMRLQAAGTPQRGRLRQAVGDQGDPVRQPPRGAMTGLPGRAWARATNVRWWGPPRRPTYGSISTTDRTSRSLPTSLSAAGGSDRLLQERSGSWPTPAPAASLDDHRTASGTLSRELVIPAAARSDRTVLSGDPVQQEQLTRVALRAHLSPCNGPQRQWFGG